MKTKINLLISTLVLAASLSCAGQTALPVITQQPVGLVVPVSSAVVLTVVATGNSLQYQWTFNGDVVPGATNATFTLASVTQDNSGAFRVMVFSSGGTVNSTVADVLIVTPAAGFADNFAYRGTINASYGLLFCSSQGATTETGEPKPCNGRVKKSVWLSWVAPANGVANLVTVGSAFDTVLAVYTGTSVSALTEVAADDDLGGNHTSSVLFNATAGTTYQIYVGSLDEDGGDVLFGWILDTNVQALPTITSKPTDITALPGAAASLCVQFTSSGPMTIQWYRNGQLIPGANQNCLQWSSLTTADLGTYRVSFTSAYWTLNLKPVEIQFNSEGLTTVAARNKLVYAKDSAHVSPVK